MRLAGGVGDGDGTRHDTGHYKVIEEAVTYKWFRYVTALRSSSDTQERSS